MDVDVAERHLLHEVHAHHHHPGDPEEDDVEARDEHRGGVIALSSGVLSGQPMVEKGQSADENQVSSTSLVSPDESIGPISASIKPV